MGIPTHQVERDLHYYWTFGTNSRYCHVLEYSYSFYIGYIRPVLGIILMLFGYMGEMHPFFRIFCAIGALIQCPFDFFSGILVGEYMDQVSGFNAKTGRFSSQKLLQYYWRDVVSFGLCVWISLLALHLCCLVGFVQAPYISYRTIAGGETDRILVMESAREKRKEYDIEQDIRLERLQFNKKNNNSSGLKRKH